MSNSNIPTEVKFRKYNDESTLNVDDAADQATFSVVGHEEGDKFVKDLYLHKTKMTDVYNSRKNGNVHTTATVGGIPAGTQLSTLTSMSLGEVIDMMLFKSYPPEHTNPTLTIQGTSKSLLVGSWYDPIQTYSTDKGKYTKYNNNLDYAGEPISGSYVGTNTNGGHIGTSAIIRKARINFAAGPIPKDSDGNPYTGNNMPYPGGTVWSNEITLTPYYNWYVTGKYVSSESVVTPDSYYTSIHELAKMTTVNYMGINNVTVMVDLGDGNINNKHTIKVPGNITNVKVFKEGMWKEYAFSEWYDHTISSTQENGIYYHIYTMKDSAYANGSVGGTRLKFTVSVQ